MANLKNESPEISFARQFGYTNETDGTIFSPSKKNDAQYGNSRFSLRTYDKNNQIELYGLLSEMPEFSFNIDFIEGPGKTTQDMLSSFFENDLFSIVNALGSDSDGSKFNNLINVGKLSRDMYNGFSINDIVLKFRIYAQNILGQTPPFTWKKYLTEFAVPNSENEYSIQNGINNIIAGLENAKNIGTNAGIIFAFNAQKSINEKRQDNLQKQKNAEEYDDDIKNQNLGVADRSVGNSIIELFKTFNSNFKTNLNAEIDKHIRNIIESTNNEFRKKALIQFYSNLKASNFDIKFDVYEEDNAGNFGLKGWLNTEESHLHYIKYHILSNNKPFDINKRLLDLYKSHSNLNSRNSWSDNLAVSNGGNINVEYIKKQFNDLKEVLQRHKNYFEIEVLIDFIINEIYTLMEKICNVTKIQDALIIDKNKNNNTTITDTVKNVYNKLENVSNNLQQIIGNKFGPGRVSSNLNKNNSLGEKLWELTIYDNFLFKKPIIVAIKDWEIKESKEIINNMPVYTDITITTCFDQVYSNKTLNDLIYSNQPVQ